MKKWTEALKKRMEMNLKGCIGMLCVAFLISHFSFRAVPVWVPPMAVGMMMTRLAS